MKKTLVLLVIAIFIFMLPSCSQDDTPTAPDAEKTAEAVLTEAARTQTAEAYLYTATVTLTITRTPDLTATAEAILTMVGAANATETQVAKETQTAEAALWTDTPTSTATPIATSGGRIAFTSNRDGNNEIYIMSADGSNITRLTNNPASDSFPAWSPDGSKIAFVGNRDGSSEIYVMDANGSGQVNITNNSVYNGDNDGGPTWSPNGDNACPSWSPDGVDITYHTFWQDLNNEIIRGGNITNHSADDQHPSWSPDGSKIAFASNRAFSYDIYVMGIDGSNWTNITNNSANDRHPSWGPLRIAAEITRYRILIGDYF